MRCTNPIKAYQDGSGKLFFWHKAGTDKEISVRCGQCVGCRLHRSRIWATRCMHEASLYDSNLFVTLTYADAPRSLVYKDFQDFMKRLRKHFPGVRFYMCGEYGEKNGRPHFHACLFNIDFPDKRFYKRDLWVSPFLDHLWGHGFCNFGTVTFESAAYVARYVMKKVTGDLAESHYTRVCPDTGEIYKIVPEFCHMSNRPGIGSGWLDKYFSDIYPDGRMLSRGHFIAPARYYDKLFRRLDSVSYDRMKRYRISDAENDINVQFNNTDSRLKVLEEISYRRAFAYSRKSL